MASFVLKFPRGVVWYCFDIGFGIGIGIGIYGILNGMWSKTFQEKCQILKQEDTTANGGFFGKNCLISLLIISNPKRVVYYFFGIKNT